MENKTCSTMTSFGLLILRLGFGGYMLTHGLGKLAMLQAGAEFADPIGLGRQMSLILVTIAECLCPILIMIGLGTRFAAIPTVCAMLVAAFVAHKTDPWTMGEAAKLFQAGEAKSWASKEPALLYLIPYLALIFTGAGCFLIDGLIRGRRKPAEPAKT